METKSPQNRYLIPMAIIIAGSIIAVSLFIASNNKNTAPTNQSNQNRKESQLAQINLKKIYAQVNPEDGFALNVKYGNIGYQLVADGAINFDKFKAVYNQAGDPLTKEQLQIFSKKGLNKPIVINRKNSYFLLNLFWAFGLANENSIITNGPITKYGEERIGSFASTGGWTIARKPLKDFMAKSQLATLTNTQQIRLQKVAENVYRPCCGNSAMLPGCNHGMAMLGMLELMASNGASEAEMFDAAKYFSAFWFPSQAVDVANFFMTKDGKSFAKLNSRTFVSKEYWSARGLSQVKQWLQTNAGNGINQKSGGSNINCGVEGGTPSGQSQNNQKIAPQGGGGCGV